MFAFAVVAQFFVVASFAASAIDYSHDYCQIKFETGSPAADNVVEPGQNFSASFLVYNGSPSVNGSSQELWPSASGAAPASTRFKLVPWNGSSYDTTWSAGNEANVAPYTAELYGGTNSGYGYVIGRLNNVDARTGLGNGSYKAPAAEGTYPFKFRLKQAGGSWHPTAICSVNIQVKKAATTQPPSGPRTNPHVCNKPYPALLKSGDRNNVAGRTDQCVTALQYALQSASQNYSAPALTGVIDAATVQYIKYFQGFFGLAQTGQLDSKGMDDITKVFGPFKSGSTTQPPDTRSPNPYVCNKAYPTISLGYRDKVGRSDQCVSAVQYNLKAALSTLQVNGVVDSTTERAIKNFQAFLKLPVTGVLPPDQVELVGKALGAFKTSTTSTTRKLHIVIAGANYTDQVTFDRASSSAAGQIISTPPYSTRKDVIVIHKVRLERPVTCAADPANPGRAVSCDPANVASQLSAAGVTADKVVTLWGDAPSAGAFGVAMINGKYATASSATAALHELSHLMGLWDEYAYSGTSGSQRATANCKDDSPNPFWQPTDQQFNTCMYGNWRRGSQSNIMNIYGASTFSPPAVRVINSTIDNYVK